MAEAAPAEAAPAAVAAAPAGEDRSGERAKYFATDEEFQNFLKACDDDEGWTAAHTTETMSVWKKEATNSAVNMIKVKTFFTDVEPETLYDVLHDHYFRRTWDDHMIEGSIVEQVDPTNEVGYYACKMPFPMANRDFLNHRSWRVFPETKTWVIFNKSVHHPGCPERSKFTRGWSFLSGYLMRKREEGGTYLVYYTQNDPRGWIPPFLMNMVSTTLTPNILATVHASALKYKEWKAKNHSDWKPWLTGYDPKAEPYQRHIPDKK